MKSDELPDEVDVVVVGAGIGGLTCGALLAKYGLSVAVCESHTIPGGAAHSFVRDGYCFDSGPSYFLGLSDPKVRSHVRAWQCVPRQPTYTSGVTSQNRSLNALKQVIDVLDEKLETAVYDRADFIFPEGLFRCKADREAYEAGILRFGGDEALKEWRELDAAMSSLGSMAATTPFAAFRDGPGMALTFGKYLPQMIDTGFFQEHGLAGGLELLQGNFSMLLDKHVKSPFLRQLMELECFVISGVLSKDTSAGEMAYLFKERNSLGAKYDYPMGGSQALIDALVRGMRKHGGKLALGTHVEQIVVEGAAGATGVRLKKGGRVIRARRAVVTNASVWDTVLHGLLPENTIPPERIEAIKNADVCDSFMHLHLGIDATGLPEGQEGLGIHHLVLNSWKDGIDSNLNVFNISIPSVLDPSLAPAGKHVVHIYGAANEPWSHWEGVKYGSAEYKKLKEERAEPLWKALEKVIPDIRERAEVTLVGTPLTHQRFVRRHKYVPQAGLRPPGPALCIARSLPFDRGGILPRCRGTYGPGLNVGQTNLYTGGAAGPQTGVPNLLACGDSMFPGIGVPAAAASGMYAAHSLVGVLPHLSLLNSKPGRNL
eukprot:scaffold872_cov421-Prasinococcus_capsulatus_cf.AAC.21